MTRPIVERRRGMKQPRKPDGMSVEDWFWSRVDRSGGPSGCWPWLGGISHGYGSVCYHLTDGRAAYRSHRVAFFLTHGHLPDWAKTGEVVLRHLCHNRLCCNPAHLALGSQRENYLDTVANGRAVNPPRMAGESNPRSVLNWEKVRAIRAAYVLERSASRIARRFGVSEGAVSHVVAHRVWKEARVK